MRTIETDLVVTSDGRANVLRMPPGIRGGKYRAILVIDDEPQAIATPETKSRSLRLSSYSAGLKDHKMTFRREDVYGSNGR